MKMRTIKLIVYIALLNVFSGCAIVDYTSKSDMNNLCVELKNKTVLYEHSCYFCKKSYGISNAVSFVERPKWTTNGEYKKPIKTLSAGTQIIITEVKKVIGITDDTPYYIKGRLMKDEPSDIELKMWFYKYFYRDDENIVMLKPAALKRCSK